MRDKVLILFKYFHQDNLLIGIKMLSGHAHIK